MGDTAGSRVLAGKFIDGANYVTAGYSYDMCIANWYDGYLTGQSQSYYSFSVHDISVTTVDDPDVAMANMFSSASNVMR